MCVPSKQVFSAFCPFRIVSLLVRYIFTSVTLDAQVVVVTELEWFQLSRGCPQFRPSSLTILVCLSPKHLFSPRVHFLCTMTFHPVFDLRPPEGHRDRDEGNICEHA